MKKLSWVLEAPATDFDEGVWGLTLIARLYNGEIDDANYKQRER